MPVSIPARVWWHVRLIAAIGWALVRCDHDRLAQLHGRGRNPDYGLHQPIATLPAGGASDAV